VKVLQVTPSFHPAYVYGGATRAVFDLCENLSQAGCEVNVLTTDANGPRSVLDVDTDREVTLGKRFTVRYCHRVIDVAVSPSLIAAIPLYVRQSDVVHLNAVYSFTTLPLLAAARTFRKPIVWSPHGMLQRWQGTSRRRIKALWEHVCKVISPAGLVLHFTSEDEQRKSLKRFKGFRSVVIPNIVDAPAPLEKKGRNGLLRLLYLGRLDPIKGIENLIQACSLLNSSSFRSWKLSIAGDGDSTYRTSLEGRIQSLGLAGQITMVGSVQGRVKAQSFCDADLVVVPSHSENFGLVVGEALANEVPVIASYGTPWKKIEEVGCGMWVDNSPESLSDSIRRAANMPLSEMGKRGRTWIDREFSGRQIADRFVNVYQGLVSATA
jgi:glycosyltransferase involved in cell wall biosynthesis